MTVFLAPPLLALDFPGPDSGPATARLDGDCLQLENAALRVTWYRDKMTGKTMDRPGWKRLEADMDVGEISKIVVWRLDRLNRTASGLTSLFEHLQRRGVGFESLRDKIDLSTPVDACRSPDGQRAGLGRGLRERGAERADCRRTGGSSGQRETLGRQQEGPASERLLPVLIHQFLRLNSVLSADIRFPISSSGCRVPGVPLEQGHATS